MKINIYCDRCDKHHDFTHIKGRLCIGVDCGAEVQCDIGSLIVQDWRELPKESRNADAKWELSRKYCMSLASVSRYLKGEE